MKYQSQNGHEVEAFPILGAKFNGEYFVLKLERGDMLVKKNAVANVKPVGAYLVMSKTNPLYVIPKQGFERKYTEKQ